MEFQPSLDFANQCVRPLADRALFWPRHGALIVADLHLEKASWFAAQGQPLPPYDSHDTLDRLDRLVDATGARAIWCLGDSFHDRLSADRMAPAAAERLASLSSRVELLWIAGNHDGLSAGAWGGAVAAEIEVDGIVFRHQCKPADRRPQVSGHFHPKLRVNLRGRPVVRPCFARDERTMILPAFGSLTGGLDVGDDAIAANFDGTYHAMVVAGEKLLSVAYGRAIFDDATSSGHGA
ncbi:ligase-associated DNA damage response endonuclease PdeM [Sphingopyxis sp. XHP0097]|uniref:Ligase-associated DNA damage response endonuclease PdeM n=1 Tax=Sphingopyxis jiangsuensis TaxID=2871171 RepID=A0ABS7MFD6_9SPHN|nr:MULTISPECIES: ligase-associated DNA damage response endonuclease PdeM [Sphingopyxis]MBL0769405.1 ligase-associated DNA damage response endonuclease PdeM [Sphingopyxis lutea]MBY4637487.1 ligase-associated DNA damage response endonuclease PdeM [Sphingopyxis jiangsuensis]